MTPPLAAGFPSGNGGGGGNWCLWCRAWRARRAGSRAGSTSPGRPRPCRRARFPRRQRGCRGCGSLAIRSTGSPLRDYYGGEERREGGRTVREFELTAEETEIEVAPGVVYPAWAYNGQVPGPTLRATEGERLRIRFKNNSPHPPPSTSTAFTLPTWTGSSARRAGAGVRLRIRRRAGRATSLPLSRIAAQEAHRKRSLRGLHHRPRRRPSRGRLRW